MGARVSRFTVFPLPFTPVDVDILNGALGSDRAAQHRRFFFGEIDHLDRTWPLLLPEEQQSLGADAVQQCEEEWRAVVKNYDDYYARRAIGNIGFHSPIPQLQTRSQTAVSTTTLAPDTSSSLQATAPPERTEYLAAAERGALELPVQYAADLPDPDLRSVRARLRRVPALLDLRDQTGRTRREISASLANVQPQIDRPSHGINIRLVPQLSGSALDFSRGIAHTRREFLQQPGSPLPQFQQLIKYDPNLNAYRVCVYTVSRRFRDDFYECSLCEFTAETTDEVQLHFHEHHINIFSRALTFNSAGEKQKK